MKIVDMFKQKKPVLGFEIFPPKPDTPLETIYEKLEAFKQLQPDYISVTYGAGGSQKGRTVEIASKIKNEYGMESMSHFTCVGHSQEEIDEMLELLKKNNVENILALRGDPPLNQPNFDFSRNVYRYAGELISHIKDRNSAFSVAAAAYVEGHVQSKRIKDDIGNLIKKVEAGVDFLITQLFFDNRIYFDFIDRIASLGIKCPVIPGIMPVFKAEQIKPMAMRSGVSIPARLVLIMDKYSGNPDDMRKAGVEYAAEQIRDLVENGVPGVHLYTMNRPKSTGEILNASGLR